MNETPPASTGDDDALPSLHAEIQRLRRAILRHGHAQDAFQEWFAAQVDRLTTLGAKARNPGAAEVSSPTAVRGGELSQAQLRVLLELDQAVLHLIRLAVDQDAGTADEPQSLREGLDFLKIRVRNLQKSFGVEPIATVAHPFDDRIHTVGGVEQRAEQPDRQILEEILPGYRLNDQILRPALVIVNHHPEPAPSDQPESERGDL